MKIKYVEGDLLLTDAPYILHGCNAQGVMGSGVAKAIRAKYPSAYSVYCLQHEKGEAKLGAVTFALQDDGKTVLNAITQEFYGRDGKQYVNYNAVRDALQRINWWFVVMYTDNAPEVAMPKIGAGLGNGDWDVIAEIIEEESTNFKPVVYTL